MTRSDHGAVFIIVLWIALGLVTLALLFGNSMMLEYRASDNALAARQAREVAAGAARYVSFVLSDLATPGITPDLTEYSIQQVPVGEGYFWLVGRDPNNVPDEQARYGLVEESGKLNLNTAPLEMLELLPQMTTELAAAIVDWRDTDDDITPNGAESETYLRCDPPYNCKNSPFESIEELRLLAGADVEILYGEDTNRNGVLDPNEDDGDASPPHDNSDGRLDPGVLEYVTIYSRESNTQSDGQPKIDINSGPAQLQEALATALGEERAQQIMQSLGPGGRFGSLLDFYARAQITVDEGLLLDGVLTANAEGAAQGLVNINAAPEAVLACLPGIGQEGAPAIVAYRQSKTGDELATVAWLLEAVDPEKAVEAGPFVTARSYQWTADVAAVGRGGRGFTRLQYVIDAAGGTPTVLYRRDLTHLGWPLGMDVRATLASMEEKSWR